MEKGLKANVAKRIAKIMEAREMSQADLSRASGISKPHISRILRGSENITLDTLSTLERVLGAPIVEISKKRPKPRE